MTALDGLTISISIALNNPAFAPDDAEDLPDPSLTGRATKAEANYRPAYLDPEEAAAARDRAHQRSLLTRGRLDHMEIPTGLPSEEGDRSRILPGHVHEKECASCLHYGVSDCDLVAGIIDPEYVCDWWEDSEADVA